MVTRAALIATMLFGGLLAAEDGGRLQSVRREVRDTGDGRPTPRPQQTSTPSYRHPHHHHRGETGLLLWFLASGSDVFHCPGYPYALGRGWQRWEAPDGGNLEAVPYAIRGRAEYGRIDDELSRWGFDTSLTAGLFELHVDWSRFNEDGADSNDHLALGAVDLLIAGPIAGPNLRLGAGFGVGWLNDRFGSESGAHVCGLAQVFPFKPLLLEVSARYGSIGEADSWRVQSLVGVQISHGSLYVGWDAREIGGVDLSGPVIGLGFWF